ncbi:glycosyltransferase [Candidatus Thioglobus sp.]|nr:glycosyltransferase [Candidatus Thioglobus sp.]
MRGEVGNIKISVVMSVFNGERYLEDSIKSILNQSYRDIEFIIINDGSTDCTLEIIKRYQNADNRIILIDQENMGLTKSLNVGLKHVTGDYVARMDADDISTPDRFTLFLKFMRINNNVSIYTTPALMINKNETSMRVIPNYFRRNGFNQVMLNYHNSLIHGALIIKTNLIKKFKYNEAFGYSQDFELYHRLMRNKHSISYDKNNITYKLRIHTNSISNTHSSEQLKLYRQIFNDNNLKFYEVTLLNKVYFRIIDVFYFFYENSKRNKKGY